MDKNQYSTSSIALATAIQLASESKLQLVDRSRPDRCEFIFDRTSDLDQVVSLFWQKALPLDALSYFETLRYIKARLYEQKGNKE